MDLPDPRMLERNFANSDSVFIGKLPVHQIVDGCCGDPPGTKSHIQDDGDGKERIGIGNAAK